MGEYTEYILNLNKLLAGYLVKEEIEPKVSVVVPAYNVEKYIERCLVSLIKQTLREIEIIVVDDGSTDFTSGIINAFAKIDKRIKVIMQENLKQGSARNNGMKIAKGEYIGFVDSDDWVDFAYFEKMYNAVKKYGSDIALSTNVRVGNGVTKKRLNLKTEKVYTQLQDKFDVSNIIKNPCPTNKIYLKEFLEKYEIKFPESVYCEDKLFCCKAIFYANALVTVPENYYYYYRNPLSTVNTVSKKHIADKKQAKKDVFEFLKNQKANIRDKNLWQEKYSFKIGKIPLFEKREYLFSEKYILFGLIKIFEKKRVN